MVLSWSFPTLTAAGTTLRSVETMRVFRAVEDLPITAMTALMGAEPVSGDQPTPILLFANRPPLAPQQFRSMRQEIAVLQEAEIPAAIAGSRIVFRDTPPIRTSDGRPVRLHYAVAFESEEAPGEPSNVASIIPLGVALPPRNVTATAEPAAVVLQWSAPGRSIIGEENPGLSGYNIYRVPPAGETVVLETPLNGVPVSETTWRDVPPYGTHGYRVTAVTIMTPQRSESDPATAGSIEFRDLIAPPPATNVVTLTEDDAIRILWDPVEAADLKGYMVWRESPPRGRVSLTSEPIIETSFRDTKLEPGVTYIYQVMSVDNEGNESELAHSAPVLSPH